MLQDWLRAGADNRSILSDHQQQRSAGLPILQLERRRDIKSVVSFRLKPTSKSILPQMTLEPVETSKACVHGAQHCNRTKLSFSNTASMGKINF